MARLFAHHWLCGAVAVALALGPTSAPAAAEPARTGGAQARLTRDLATGRRVVVHVVVALADNRYQGIVPVPAAIGNGQDPRRNLYWGAAYGVKTYFRRKGWRVLWSGRPRDPRILERLVLFRQLPRRGGRAPVYVVADAWDGRYIAAATRQFLAIAAGRSTLPVTVRHGGRGLVLAAGGAAHMTVYIGHNRFLDGPLSGASPPANAATDARPARAAIVLACISRRHFGARLRARGAEPLLMTNGLMAPEAYTLEAALRAWVAGRPRGAVMDSAARAYNAYQKTGLRAARGLFRAPR